MFINSFFHRANGTVLLIQQTEACVLWMIILFPMESAGCWLTVTMVMYLFGSRELFLFFLKKNVFPTFFSESIYLKFLEKISGHDSLFFQSTFSGDKVAKTI